MGVGNCAPGAAGGRKLLSRRPPQGPQAPGAGLPARGVSGERRGTARIWPRREEELAEGPPPSCARRSAAQEASLQGPGGNFSLEALILARVHARSHSGTRTPSAHLPRAPSVWFFLIAFILTL